MNLDRERTPGNRAGGEGVKLRSPQRNRFEAKTAIKEGISPQHNRDGTPCGELAIPYIDLIWSCARRKAPKT